MDKSYFEQLKQLVGRSNRVRANFLKVEDKAKVLVLPITPQTVVPRFQHWIGKRSVVCLKTFNKECPICLEKGEQPQKQLLFSVLPLKGEEIDFQIHIMPTPPSFLSLIDEGEIQEVSTGIRVPFRGIVIFTSNLYNQTIGELANKIEDDVLRELLIRDLFTGKYSEILKYVPEQILGNDIRNFQITQSFPPEFIGRIDKIVPFGDLTREDLYYIVVKALEREGYTDWREWVFNVAAFVDKYHPLVERYGIRYLIRKAIEDAANIKAGTF